MENLKKIRLSESELISLIQKVIKETEEDMNTEKKVGNYNGKSELSLMQNLGTKTYLDIIRGEKNKLFNRILQDKHFKISTPDEKWYEDNIENLNLIKKIFKSSKGRLSWRDGDYLTFEEKIDSLIERCNRREYVGFIEENEDRKVWSILNKLDTNYTNWESMINNRLMGGYKKTIDGSDRTEVINNFFKQRPLSDILPSDRLINFKELEIKLGTNIKTLSYADLDLLETFGKKNSKEFQDIYNTISYSTNIGDELETKFLTYLRNKKDSSLEIIDFSSPGSIVDTAFGIDCAIKLHGIWYAVQIKAGSNSKNTAQKSFINNLGINSLSIYERNKNYEFNYFSPTKKEGENNFNEDFGF